MAIDQLSLYNDALLLLGQRKLDSLAEAREPRYRLDDIYGLEAIRYCLELAKPVFARTTTKLTVSSTPTNTSFTNLFTLPSDYVSTVEIYIDGDLDRPLKRYLQEGSTIACNYATIYVRYITDSKALTAWSPAFAKLFAAYLAQELATRIAPEELETAVTRFTTLLESIKALNLEQDPETRPNKYTSTLTNAWRYIYNDALLILGLDTITSNDDDSDRRSMLDDAYNSGVVQAVLEDTAWSFGTTSTQSQYNPSVEPVYGYRRAHDHPADMHRLDGIFQDEYLTVPLKNYHDEDEVFFTDLDTIYVKYVSTDFLITPNSWPTHFKRLIAARLAKDVVLSVYRGASANERRMMLEAVTQEYNDRRREAMANDAMSAPPQRLSQGSWNAARYRGTSRNRPGGY